MILTAYGVLLSTTIVLAWGFFNLLKLNQEKSEEISRLRLELFSAEIKNDMEDFKRYLDNKGEQLEEVE